MNQIQAQGIILSRTDYGEADRIITLLTPDQGKLRLMARGVRRVKSKLAGGVELFSVSDITYVRGRGEIGTLISARLREHYGDIVKDVNRTMLGYELIKQLHRATEDETEAEYFGLLEQSFMALNNAAISVEIIRAWFAGQLIKIAGFTPNLSTDTSGQKLTADQSYTFNYDAMAFEVHPEGTMSANHIKGLRLFFGIDDPQLLHQVHGLAAMMTELNVLMRTVMATHIRV